MILVIKSIVGIGINVISEHPYVTDFHWESNMSMGWMGRLPFTFLRQMQIINVTKPLSHLSESLNSTPSFLESEHAERMNDC